MGIDSSVARALFRASKSHQDSKVGFVELFFDLIFVFAVTQLSHFLLHNFTLVGLSQTAFLTLSVWWVWVYTTWVTNWLDPETTLVRLMLFVLMFAGLIMSISIPHAFSSMGIVFATAYAFMQVSRSVFMWWAMLSGGAEKHVNFARISAWLATSAVFWITGGLFDGTARYCFWLLALGIEYLGPFAGFWTPLIGRSITTDWDISGAHMAERCGLFIIIALGESLLITGSTFADKPWTMIHVSAFITAFLSTVAMWWVYFNVGAEHAAKRIEKSDDPARIGRLAYTYLHIPIVGGIILAAVSDELILAHPFGQQGTTDALLTIALLGGALLFILGNLSKPSILCVV